MYPLPMTCHHLHLKDRGAIATKMQVVVWGLNHKMVTKLSDRWGRDCDSVGRVVTSETRGPQFESSHRQNFIVNICTG